MNEKPKDKLDDERAARIDILANKIIEDEQSREAERLRHNEEEMKKLVRWLESKSPMTPTDSQLLGSSKWNR